MRIKVGVVVFVGVGVSVVVDDGRNVHVGRGVRVEVHVVEGVRLVMLVLVDTIGKVVLDGLIGGFET